MGRTGARFPSAAALDPEPHTDDPPESGDLATAPPPDDPHQPTADEPPPDDAVAATGARFGPYSAGKSKRPKAFDPRSTDAHLADPRAADVRATDPRPTDARFADARFANSRATDPRVADARAADARLADPLGTHPSVTDPRATGGRATDPRLADARPTDPRLVDAPPAQPPSVVPPGEPTPEQSAERTVHIVHPWAGALVRPYAHTGGRTRASHDLALEALISSSSRPRAGSTAALTTHHRRMIVDLCARPRSVAEVAALLSVPLGVARVLVGDLATAGAVVVHPTAGDGAPDVAFMRRVLVGLRRL